MTGQPTFLRDGLAQSEWSGARADGFVDYVSTVEI